MRSERLYQQGAFAAIDEEFQRADAATKPPPATSSSSSPLEDARRFASAPRKPRELGTNLAKGAAQTAVDVADLPRTVMDLAAPIAMLARSNVDPQFRQRLQAQLFKQLHPILERAIENPGETGRSIAEWVTTHPVEAMQQVPGGVMGAALPAWARTLKPLTQGTFKDLRALERAGELGELKRAAGGDVAKINKLLPKFTTSRAGVRALSPKAPDVERMKRLYQILLPEIEDELVRGGVGSKNFYSNISASRPGFVRELAETDERYAPLAAPGGHAVYSALESPFSSGMSPSQEFQTALSVMPDLLEGRIPDYKPGTYNPRLGRGADFGPRAPAVRSGLATVHRILEDAGGDYEKAAQLLTEPQDLQLLSRWRGNARGVRGNYPALTPGTDYAEPWLEHYEGGLPGAFALGPKIGAYTLNKTGDFYPGTQDTWMIRTLNRALGSPPLEREDFRALSAVGRGQASERAVAQHAIEAVAQQLGLDPAAVQSLAWHDVKNVYELLGTRPVSAKSQGTLQAEILEQLRREGKVPEVEAAPYIPPAAVAQKGSWTAAQRRYLQQLGLLK